MPPRSSQGAAGNCNRGTHLRQIGFRGGGPQELRMSKVVNAPISLWITGQVSNWIQIFLFGFGESGHRGAKAKRPGFSFNKMFLQAHRTSVGRKERSCSSQQIRAPCAAPRPLLQRLSRTLCTSSLRFTDTSVTGAGRSNRWLCFVRRRCNR